LVGTSTINKHAFRAIYQFLQALEFLGKTLYVDVLGLGLLSR
jgi:hypothetical protein